MNIKHQQQPTWNSCMSACVAMILNKPVNEVIDEFHDDYRSEKIDTDEYLRLNGVDCEVLLSNAKFEAGNIYVCSVPSLNKQAQTHAVIIDMREEFWCIYDPNQGKEDKLYYVPNSPDVPLEENQVYLITASADLKINFK